MAVTAAEKQRCYREKRDADPEKRAMFLKQQRERYERDKQRGLKKGVKDMSPREHGAAKKVWRNQNRATREKQKELENVETPRRTPPSPDPPYPSPEPVHHVKDTSSQNTTVVRLCQEKNINSHFADK